MKQPGTSRSVSRRRFLKYGALSTAFVAGCTGPPDEEPTIGTGVPTRVTDTATQQPIEDSETEPAPSTEESTDSTPERSESATYIYLRADELDGIIRCVEAGDQPWKKAYNRAMKHAKKAMDLQPRSVVDDGAPGWDNEHRFGTDPEDHDYFAAITMTRAVRDLGLAYGLTGDDTYAERAIDLIHHWCLDGSTYMAPDADVANDGTEISLHVTIPKLWYGAAFLRDHPYWRTKGGEAAFREWVSTLIESLPGPGYFQYDNHWAWRISTISSAASYLGDDSLLETAFCMWRGRCETEANGKAAPRPWNQYSRWQDSASKGFLKRERNREDGLRYHLYGMKALTMTAEVARTHGVDLYSFNAPTDPVPGSTLKKLYDWMIPYLESPDQWKWGMGESGLTSSEERNIAALYELPYSQWRDDAYRRVIERYGRPGYDSRLLGWTTLTHGNRFELE